MSRDHVSVLSRPLLWSRSSRCLRPTVVRGFSNTIQYPLSQIFPKGSWTNKWLDLSQEGQGIADAIKWFMRFIQWFISGTTLSASLFRFCSWFYFSDVLVLTLTSAQSTLWLSDLLSLWKWRCWWMSACVNSHPFSLVSLTSWKLKHIHFWT